MTDEEKILSDLKGIAEYFMELYREEEDHHIYDQHRDRMAIVESACNLIEELLKKQEPRDWIYCEDDSGQDGYRCSKCGFFEPWYYNYTSIDFIKKYQFCPSCGATMKERNNEHQT